MNDCDVDRHQPRPGRALTGAPAFDPSERMAEENMANPILRHSEWMLVKEVENPWEGLWQRQKQE